eukprot:jgi/Chrzof1/1817/Cz10g22090.t1
MQPVQKIRCFKDKSYVRWPPHINLLYPFWEDKGDCFEAMAAQATQALAHIPPFTIMLSKFSYFNHGRSCAMWLDPDNEQLQLLQSALVSCFPDCNDLNCDPSRGIDAFTPHLSVGQWKDEGQVKQAIQEYSVTWSPITLPVFEVCLISRRGYQDPFTVRYSIPLGSATASAVYKQPQVVDVPYVSTTGCNHDLLTTAPDSNHLLNRYEFGLGAQSQGLWNFAYGANMCPNKLQAIRGLQPLQSKPAKLEGYSLRFDHRGGFGNLVKVGESSGAAEKGVVHGVLHQLSLADMGSLMNMEHEYWPVEVVAEPYDGSESVVAVAFITPPDRQIRDGLPTISRYLDLIVAGAKHWNLDPNYVSWLQSTPTIDSSGRGSEFYTSADGTQKLLPWPKTRTGSQSSGPSSKRGKGRGRGNRGQ